MSKRRGPNPGFGYSQSSSLDKATHLSKGLSSADREELMRRIVKQESEETQVEVISATSREYRQTLFAMLREEPDKEKRVSILTEWLDSIVRSAPDAPRMLRKQRNELVYALVEQQEAGDTLMKQGEEIIQAQKQVMPKEVTSEDDSFERVTGVSIVAMYSGDEGVETLKYTVLNPAPMRQAILESWPLLCFAAMGTPTSQDIGKRHIPGLMPEDWQNILAILHRCHRISPADFNVTREEIFEQYWPKIEAAMQQMDEATRIQEHLDDYDLEIPNGLKDARETIWGRFKKDVKAAIDSVEDKLRHRRLNEDNFIPPDDETEL